jgi:uncharacterized LabA/DUF88 family protein
MARVGVFIDGQNITIGARYAFEGSGNMHPLLLGRELAAASGPGGRDENELVEIRYATGLPDMRHDPERAEPEQRRHDLMRQTDVVVLEKRLRYRWEWQIRDRDLPDPRDARDDVRQARVVSQNRGQEKGIDVWLALDALVMCARADLDRVVIATADSDLNMVPHYVRALPGQGDTEVVAAMVVNGRGEVRHNDAYDRTIAIDQSMYDRAVDRFDYERPLDQGEVDRFLAGIGSASDGIRD